MSVIRHKRLEIEELKECDCNHQQLDGIIEYLIGKKEEFNKQGYYSITMGIESYDYHDSGELNFTVKRLETDEEYNKRIAKITAEEIKQLIIKQKKSEQEYKKYLELRAKFEPIDKVTEIE